MPIVLKSVMSPTIIEVLSVISRISDSGVRAFVCYLLRPPSVFLFISLSGPIHVIFTTTIFGGYPSDVTQINFMGSRDNDRSSIRQFTCVLFSDTHANRH